MTIRKTVEIIGEVKIQHSTDFQTAIRRNSEPMEFSKNACYWRARIIGKAKLPFWAKCEIQGHFDALFSLINSRHCYGEKSALILESRK